MDYKTYRLYRKYHPMMAKEAFFDRIISNMGETIIDFARDNWRAGKAAVGKAYNAAKNMWNQGNAYADQNMQNRNINSIWSAIPAVGQHMMDHAAGMVDNMATNTAGRLKQPGRYVTALGRNLWNGQGLAKSNANAIAYANAKYVPYNGVQAAKARQQAKADGLRGFASWHNYNNNYLYPQQARQLAAAGLDSRGLPVPQANQQ